MIFRPRHNHKIVMYQPQMKGTGIGSVLLDGGAGGQSSYASLEDYKDTTTKGYGLHSNNLGMKLSKLVIKQPTQKKQPNIKFNL